VDEYTATATVYVMKEKTEGGSTSTSEVSIANTLVKDFMELTTMDSVLEKVCDGKYINLTPAQLRKMVTVKNIESTRFIYVSVTAKDAQSAHELSISLAENACEYLNHELLGDQKYASVADRGLQPKKPSNPISALKLMLIALVCALVVYVIYLVLFMMDDKINTPEDVEKYLKLSILGQIPNKDDTSRRRKRYGAYGTYYASNNQMGAPVPTNRAENPTSNQ
jgi:capsular polysaccharide biosynthesis protein